MKKLVVYIAAFAVCFLFVVSNVFAQRLDPDLQFRRAFDEFMDNFTQGRLGYADLAEEVKDFYQVALLRN